MIKQKYGCKVLVGMIKQNKIYLNKQKGIYISSHKLNKNSAPVPGIPVSVQLKCAKDTILTTHSNILLIFCCLS